MKKVSFFAAASAVLAFVANDAQAQFKGVGKVAMSVIENNFPANPTNFSFVKEKGKIQMKPSKKDGDGGLVTQLNLKFVDCPGDPYGNDSGAGTCGPKGAIARGA